MRSFKPLVPFLAAAALTVPATVVHLAAWPIPPQLMALVSGLAILGSSFILLWACDAAQSDVSKSLALAAVALIAVLPEYAVDMYITWQAGKMPQSEYASFAIANMTGANRLLIGVAWAAIAFVFWFKTRKPVFLERDRKLELVFLGLATLYALVIPIKGSLAWYDAFVFIGLYTWYIRLASKRPVEEEEAQGPAAFIQRMPKLNRRLTTSVLFVFAAAMIMLNARPFSEGLIATGTAFHINKFLLVQWLAPIASEAPEFIVAIMFAMRGQASLALGSLVCAKLNQWTLLVGMIPGAYALSHGSLDHPIPMGSFQMHEILLTAAQSLLAVVILALLRLSAGQALLLFGLFVAQLVGPEVLKVYPNLLPVTMTGEQLHQFFSIIYVIVAAGLLIDQPKRLRILARAFLSMGARSEDDEPAVVVDKLPHGCRASLEAHMSHGKRVPSLCPRSVCPNARCGVVDCPANERNVS